MAPHATPYVELVNVPWSRLSDSWGMTPWEVIEEVCLHKRRQNWQSWLAEQLAVKVAVVNNWRGRGVPPARYREIATALGITLDQLEGLEELPWKMEAQRLSPEVQEIAERFAGLKRYQIDWAMRAIRDTLTEAPTVGPKTARAEKSSLGESSSSRRRSK